MLINKWHNIYLMFRVRLLKILFKNKNNLIKIPVKIIIEKHMNKY